MMNKRYHSIYKLPVIAILCCIVISSCKVTRDYVKPVFNLPGSYSIPDSVNEDMDSGIVSWKVFFKDSILTNILDSAIANNFDLRDALKNVAIADQYYKQSSARFMPSVDLNLLGVNKQYRSDKYYSTPASKWYDRLQSAPPKNLYTYQSQFINSVEMEWEVDIWGKMKRQKEEANAKYLQTYEARRAIQTALVADVAENYYLLLMLHEQLQVAQRNFVLRDNTLKMVELQYQSGDVTALAVEQTKSQVLEAQALIPQLEKEIALHKNRLMLLTGQLSSQIVPDKQLSEIRSNHYLKELPLYMVQNRPDVKAAEYELKAANAKVGVTQAYRYPNVSIDLTGGVNAMLPKNWFNIPGALFGGLIGGVTQPLFNKRKLKTNYEVAKLERDKAEIDFQKNVYTAVIEARNALISIDKIKAQLDIAKEQVSVAQKAVSSAVLLFKAGFATYLEVITAQGHELDSELNLASIKADLLTARVQLYRALGGGWK